MKRPLVSIIVPTKDRYIYLKKLILLIESFDSCDIELVIQDNSSNNSEILSYLDIIKPVKTNYYYDNRSLSMSENSDLAYSNSKGEYICFIGDDDGVCRNIADCAKWMKNNDVESVITATASYFWNDYVKKKGRINCAGTVIHANPSDSYKLVDPIYELEKSLKSGFQNKYNMPFFYHGIIKRSVLEEVRAIGGTCFPGGSPDISNGVSNCFFVKRCAVLEVPVVINGTSNMTGGGIIRRAKSLSSLDDVGFISKSVIENWEQTIPRLWSGRFAWPESGIKGLRYTNNTNYLQNMNYDRMYASFSIYYGHFRLAFSNTPNKFYFTFNYMLGFTFRLIRGFKNKLTSYFLKKINGNQLRSGFEDIIEAESYLSKINNINFNSLIKK